MASTTTAAAAATAALTTIEAAKRKAAYQAVAEHFTSTMTYIGIGSGSTIVYGVSAIADHLAAHPPPAGHKSFFVPTGSTSRSVIVAAGLTPLAFDALPAGAQLEVAFDGADEVDTALNCVKGGGACLFQEKLVVCRARKWVCVADYRKAQGRLLTGWPAIPIEVAPIAAAGVLAELVGLGAVGPAVRVAGEGRVPVVTDQGFWIVDAPFKTLLTSRDVVEGGKDGSGKDGVWEVDILARAIKAIHGVLEVGLFHGMNGIEAQAVGLQGGQKPVAVYFGLADGEVEVRQYQG